MNLDFLSKLTDKLPSLNISKVSEIRIRKGYPVKVRLFDEVIILNDCIYNDEEINEIITCITEKSLYAYNDYIKQGFVTTRDGIRVGISGECVFDNGRIQTIKNFSSLNVRIPHEIENCANLLFPYIYNKSVYNSLIFSSPFKGKTTVLKDLIRKLNKTDNSIFIIDERGEFLDINGENVDKFVFCDKEYAFECGIRAMSPSIVIVDELVSKNDWLCVEKAVLSGVKIIATCHAELITDVKNKKFFKKGIFERYFQLDNGVKMGVLKSVYDKDFNII